MFLFGNFLSPQGLSLTESINVTDCFISARSSIISFYPHRDASIPTANSPIYFSLKISHFYQEYKTHTSAKLQLKNVFIFFINF